MDAARVRDIGTSFTIQKTQDSILVSVSAGEVAFTQKASGRTREITAGGSLCLYTGASHRGEIRETASPSVAMDSLRFDDAPLSAVLATLEKRSGQSIRLTDTLMAQKRLTIKLGGESLEEALRLICASMHLDYTPQPGGYVLGRRDSARRK
jgi:ferric-dicitrate binding protein FerR (iron transport regulator)